MHGYTTLPNLFLIGLAKCGTTTLHEMLGTHPDIFMSHIKEPHHFSRLTLPGDLGLFGPQLERFHGAGAYCDLFEGADGERYVGESSTSYATCPEAAERLREVAPGARILLLLREPVGRAWSAYLNNMREGLDRLSFVEALEAEQRGQRDDWPASFRYLAGSRGADAIERYRRLFGDEQVGVFFFEDLVSSPDETVDEIQRWLGVEALPLQLPHANGHREPRNPLVKQLLSSAFARRMARAALPAGGKEWLHRNILWRPAKKPSLPDDAREILIAELGDEADRVAELTGRQPPWKAHSSARSTRKLTLPKGASSVPWTTSAASRYSSGP